MGKQHIPIYECDLCGKIFKYPKDVRIFNNVTDGEDYIFNDTKALMVGVSCCVINFLGLEGVKNDIDVKIPKNKINTEPTKLIQTEIIPIKLQQKVIISDPVITCDDINIDDQSDDDELKLEKPEDIFDDYVDENQKDLVQEFREDQDGQYLVLKKINDIEQENALILSLGHASLEHFKKNIYDESLIGIYVAVMNSVDVIIEKTVERSIKFIDNVILIGIPHVSEMVLNSSLDGQRAYISKEQYESVRQQYFQKK